MELEQFASNREQQSWCEKEQPFAKGKKDGKQPKEDRIAKSWLARIRHKIAVTSIILVAGIQRSPMPNLGFSGNQPGGSEEYKDGPQRLLLSYAVEDHKAKPCS